MDGVRRLKVFSDFLTLGPRTTKYINVPFLAQRSRRQPNDAPCTKLETTADLNILSSRKGGTCMRAVPTSFSKPPPSQDANLDYSYSISPLSRTTRVKSVPPVASSTVPGLDVDLATMMRGIATEVAISTMSYVISDSTLVLTAVLTCLRFEEGRMV